MAMTRIRRVLHLCFLIATTAFCGTSLQAQEVSFTEEVRSGRELVEIFEALADNPKTNKRALQKIAVEISQNHEARMLLKSDRYVDLGSKYYGLWYDGPDALVEDMIERTRAKLLREGYPREVVMQIVPIQNEASRRARRAPMDFDLGINSEGNREHARMLLDMLEGSRGLKRFENDLQIALEESYREIAGQLGVRNAHPGKAIITGATHFHPEAYADSVLRSAGVPGKDLIQQTADVSKYKVDDYKGRATGRNPIWSTETAWKESARGTIKDIEKMERVFAAIESSTGVRPSLSDTNLRVKSLLERVANETDEAAMRQLNEQIRVLTGGDIFDACKLLIDNMESAWRLKPTGIFTMDAMIRRLIQEADPGKRLQIVRENLHTMRNRPGKVPEAHIQALERLENILTTPKGDGFLMRFLKSKTGQMFIVDALTNAPFALYAMYQAYQQGEMNDMSDAAFVLIDFPPGGMSLKRTIIEGMNSKTVFSWIKEALYFTPYWPFVLAGDLIYLSVEVGGAVRVSNEHSGLVDLLVYNGKFERGKLTHLELLGDKKVELSNLKEFLFSTKYVAVKTSIPGWGLRINNLSEKALEVYNDHYLKNDRVLEELHKAAETQLSAINKAEADKYLDVVNGYFAPPLAALGYLVWMSGFDLLCDKSPEKWCRVFNLLKDKIEKRKEWVLANVMIPDLIRLAEEKRAKLDAPQELTAKIVDLQKKIEDLRGSPLGVTLKNEIHANARKLADAGDSKIFGATDSKEGKRMTIGEYWQAAYSAYEKIYLAQNKLKEEIIRSTGYERIKVMQFQWSGDYLQDQIRSAQSIAGFYADRDTIISDISEIKGSHPEPHESLDRRAFEILGSVIFLEREILDATNRTKPKDRKKAVFGTDQYPKPSKGSKFFKDYETALERVRALYKKSTDFQEQLNRGATIFRDRESAVIEEGLGLELRFIDEDFKKEMNKTPYRLRWASSAKGDFRPDDKSLKVKYTDYKPGTVTISVRIEKTGREEMVGILKTVVPVKVPDSFIRLSMKPATPRPGETVVVEAYIPDRFIGEKLFHYKWSGRNCQVEDVDRSSTSLTAPMSGQASVGLELWMKDGEKRTFLIEKELIFTVSAADSKPKDDKGPPPCTYQYADWGPCDEKTQMQTRRVISKSPDNCVEKDKPVLQQPCKADTKKPGDEKSGDKPIDPKSEAEAKYQWLKNVPEYLEKLIDMDKKTYDTAIKEIRKYVLKKSNLGQYPQCDTACQKRIEELRKAVGNCGPYVVREKGIDPLTGEQTLINVVKEDKPCGAGEQAAAEEAARLADPMAYEEFKCYEAVTKPHKEHQQDLKKNLAEVKESKAFKNYQEYAAWNMLKEYINEVDTLKNKLKLPDPIPVTITLPWSYSSPCGGASGVGATTMDDKSEITVILKKSPEKLAYNIGEIISISASVAGGKEPYSYTWTGNYAGSGKQVTTTSSKPGEYTLSVEVTDASGKRGRATSTIKIGGIEADIKADGKAIYGTILPISVEIKGITEKDTDKKGSDFDCRKKCCQENKRNQTKGRLIAPDSDLPSGCDVVCYENCVKQNRPESSGYRVVWHSDPPGMQFNPETSYDNRTQVLLSRMGKVIITAEIQKKTAEGTYSSEGLPKPQKEIAVVPPKFKWTFDPPKGQGKIGKEVKATVTTDPPIELKLIYYRWSYPESSNRWEDDGSASVIRFIPKDSKPMMLLVQPEVPHYRDLIGGGLKEEYQAKAYTVTATIIEKFPKPRVFNPDVKDFVDVPRGTFVADEQVTVKATVVDGPPEDQLRWSWTVNEGTSISNPASSSPTLSRHETGTAQATVIVRDKDNVILGSASVSFAVTVSADKVKPPTMQQAKEKIAQAKALVQQGKLDEAITLAEEAAKLDPKNAEAKQLADKWKRDRSQIHDQITKAKKLMDENRFDDALRELIVAKNLHGNYQPVVDADRELNDRWQKYKSQSQQKLSEVRSANERKEFKKALEIAASWRASVKLDPNAEAQLKQEENWATKMEAEKEQKRQILKKAEEKLKAYDYAGALKDFDAGFQNFQNLWASTDTEPSYYQKLREEAFQKNKRLGELHSVVRNAAENADSYYNQVHVLEPALKQADEAIGLQPTNDQWKKWREMIAARLERLKSDNERIAQGRKYLDAARNAHNSYLSQESYVKADTGRWAEGVEMQMQDLLIKAIENYRESLKYIPDAQVEKLIGELQGTLESRKKFMENYRMAKALRAEADGLAQEARAEQNFDLSQQKFAGAIEKYQKSLSLYRPPDEQTLAKIIQNLDIERKTRAFKKYWSDGTTLEQQNRVLEALAALEKAATFLTYAVMEGDRHRFQTQLQNLRNRIEYAKRLRAQGEAEERAGKLPEAITSYRNSLKNVFDTGLDSHVKALEQRLADANRGKAEADQLWEEGRALHGQGRWTEALAKFKESLTHWSNAERATWTRDFEQKRVQAAKLRDEGAALQEQGKLQDAVNKYKQSVQTWPNPDLEKHIALVEAEIRRLADANARKALADRLWQEGTSLSNQKRLTDALAKFKESLTHWQDQTRSDYVSKLEQARATAARLRDEGSALQSQGKLQDALTKYKQSVQTWPNPDLEKHIVVVENEIRRLAELEACARKNGDEGVALERQGRLMEALAKYKAGYACRQTAEMAAHIRNLETKIAQGPQPPKPPVANLTGKWAAVCTNNDNYELSIVHTGNNFEARNEPYVYRGTISGNTFSGKLVDENINTVITGEIISNNELRVEQTTFLQGTSLFRCTLTRKSGAVGTQTPSNGRTSPGSLKAEFANRSSQNVHIFVEGQDTFGPHNRISPQERKNVSIKTPARAGFISFVAGRNGQVLARCRWEYDPDTISGRVPVVTFNDPNKLSCTTGIR